MLLWLLIPNFGIWRFGTIIFQTAFTAKTAKAELIEAPTSKSKNLKNLMLFLTV